MPELREGQILVDPQSLTSQSRNPITLPNDDLLFPENEDIIPFEFMSEILKAKKERHTLIVVVYDKYTFLFRLLKRYEFETYQAFVNENGDSAKLRESMCSRAIIAVKAPNNELSTLSALNKDNLKAFTLSSLYSTILEASSFADPDYIAQLQDINAGRISTGSMDLILNWHIKSNIASVTDDDLSNMDVSQYGDLLGGISHYTEGKNRLDPSHNPENPVQSLENYIPEI